MAGLIAGIAGLVIQAGTTAVSFAQANKEKNKQLEFQNEADKALAEARKALQVNYAEQMSIKKEPYNAERMALLAQGAMITQAAAESDRGAASAAGQIYAGQQMGQANIAERQSNDLTNIENAILEEDSRLRDINVGLDTMEIQGNKQAAADARFASQQALQAGIQGVANTTQQAIAMPSLYPKSKSKVVTGVVGAGEAAPQQGKAAGQGMPNPYISSNSVFDLYSNPFSVNNSVFAPPSAPNPYAVNNPATPGMPNPYAVNNSIFDLYSNPFSI